MLLIKYAIKTHISRIKGNHKTIFLWADNSNLHTLYVAAYVHEQEKGVIQNLPFLFSCFYHLCAHSKIIEFTAFHFTFYCAWFLQSTGTSFIIRLAKHLSYFAFHRYFASIFAIHTTKFETLTIHFSHFIQILCFI